MKKLAFAFIIMLGQIVTIHSAQALEQPTGCVAIQPTTKEELSKIFQTSPLEVRNYQNAERLWKLYEGENFFLKDSEKLAHREEVIKNVKSSLDFLGYGHITPSQAFYCTNQNQTIDFNLLRYALLSALKALYIF